ncbi:hypothetical protein BAUCODRAFT_37360 [Baudoinia panamericana UAMH 10762]|uniref:Cobalamin-independent methionine synthase MetE C-terminal/archaeal domain-containing protein n=1 Tax=Baudoinia panamericana (strain UAMH 10762) TaxID=717646 RepID=M2MQA7_BAUPA|nr:uncharacterized protein BAUCODRAFT_37360 [Baudoinia panamericana UAMH 10762]EMC93658.1 hypothetical protein BAUCODRAFT_37360 [Baudoinia panamericana UAMH 10762]
MSQVRGCHLIGSVPLPDTETVLRQCTSALPHRLKRIPDGETGFRNLFTTWQSLMFHVSPELCVKFEYNRPVPAGEFSQQQVDEGIEKLEKAAPLDTGYDKVGIESYGVFKKLKDEGVIAKDTRFQVSMATPPNVLSPFVEAPFQARVEPLYQDALYRSMRTLQEKIPHQDLAIQIDLAVDTAFWDGFPWFKPWFGDGNMDKIKAYIVDYTVRMIGQVDKDVDVLIHNCYGDMEHRHWIEPISLASVTERGLRIFEKTPHNIDGFHVPVPKSAMDNLEKYLEPLKQLIPKFKEHNTDLYLGVIHYNDRAATDKMIAAAKNVLDYPFGVATECGMGRTPPEEIKDILQLSCEVSEPVF